jgi:AcrR family transcriptional regulator
MNQVVEKTRKEQIQEIAETLFKERGYAATSMRTLATELGIEPASIYSHIKNKEEILSATCFRMANEFFQGIDSIKKLDVSNAEKLRLYIVAHMNVLLENINASAVFFHDWKFMTEPNLSRFKELRKDYENEFKAVLQAGIRQQEFRIDDINFTSQTLFSAMNMTHEWYKPEGKLQGDHIGAKLADLLLNGITNP